MSLIDKDSNSVFHKVGKLTRRYWYVAVIILSILFIISQNVDFSIRSNDTTYLGNCISTGIMKKKPKDKIGVDSIILVCQRANELKPDHWISKKGRVW